MLTACGLTDTLRRTRDEVYEVLRVTRVIDRVPIMWGTATDTYPTPEHRKLGYTLFAETDQFWADALGKDVADITVEDVKQWVIDQPAFAEKLLEGLYETYPEIINYVDTATGLLTEGWEEGVAKATNPWASFFKKSRMEDALNATKAAVEEGIIFGGGSAYIHASKEVEKVIADLDGDEKTGAQIVLKALEAPLHQIAENAGLNGAVIVNKVKESEVGVGFDAYKEEYVNMIDGGILDPAKVTRSALQNATSVAASFLTTEAAVANIKEPMPPMPAGAPGMM